MEFNEFNGSMARDGVPILLFACLFVGVRALGMILCVRALGMMNLIDLIAL